MCIYLQGQEGLTYEKREHIFPAGLGGIMVLPHGVVSDQANEYFSPLEGLLMHDSLLSVPRSLLGPGKRGSLNPHKSSKSKICILEGSGKKISFGYVSGKTSYYISTLTKCGCTYTYTVASDQYQDSEQSWETFKHACLKFEDKFVSIQIASLDSQDWIFGFYESKYYLALGRDCSFDRFKKELLFIATSSLSGSWRKNNAHPKVDFRQQESDDTTRIYAKVAINALAYLLGEQYINHERFRPIKDWILGNVESSEYTQLPRITPQNVLGLPEHSHWCLFSIYNGKLTAVVCYYNAYSRYFELAKSIEKYDRNIRNHLCGLNCDWRCRQEYTFEQWVLSQVKAFDAE